MKSSPQNDKHRWRNPGRATSKLILASEECVRKPNVQTKEKSLLFLLSPLISTPNDANLKFFLPHSIWSLLKNLSFALVINAKQVSSNYCIQFYHKLSPRPITIANNYLHILAYQGISNICGHNTNYFITFYASTCVTH